MTTHMPRLDLEPPTRDDLDVIKETVLEVGEQPDARVRAVDPWRVFIKLERLTSDTERSWPLLTISFAGILTLDAAGYKMVLRYRELAHHDKTENSAVTHDYIMRTEGGEVVEFGHSMIASPELRQPRTELLPHDEPMNQAAEGERILKVNTGTQLELAAGDCGILYDRLLFLMV
jgi:hypothetical protein